MTKSIVGYISIHNIILEMYSNHSSSSLENVSIIEELFTNIEKSAKEVSLCIYENKTKYIHENVDECE